MYLRMFAFKYAKFLHGKNVYNSFLPRSKNIDVSIDVVVCQMSGTEMFVKISHQLDLW